MKRLTTTEVNERLLHIIDLQLDLIKDMMKALGPFETFDKELRRINRLKEKLEEIIAPPKNDGVKLTVP